MKFLGKFLVRNRTKKGTSATALLLLLAFSVALVAFLPAVNAIDIPTYAFLNAAPNPVGVGQETIISFWTDKVPPTILGSWYDNWVGFKLNITAPDGTVTTLGPFTSDPVGNSWTSFKPDKIGNYTLQFSFPGQQKNSTTFSNYYKPSTSPKVTLVVQQEPAPIYPGIALPTGYWQYPINANNREWSQISGDWLMTYYDSTGNKFNPYTTAPNSAHILWRKSLTFGGIAGAFGGESYYTGLSYENKFTPPILLNGRLYYNNRIASSWQGFRAVDMRTGEEIWFQNTTLTGAAGFGGGTLTCGQVYQYETPNQYGTHAYLWSITSAAYEMYDAFSGFKILTITNVTSGGTPTYGEDGSLLIYMLNGANSWFALWNSSKCIGAAGVTGTSGWQWRPQSGSTLDWKRGIEWNVTVPTYKDPRAQSITTNNGITPLLDIDSGIILAFTGNFNLGTATSWMEIGYDAKTGEQVWAVNRTFPTQPTAWGIMGVAGEGVYCEFIPNTMQWYGYDIKTGKQLWGPTEPYERAFGMYISAGASSIAYGKLFTGDFDGIVHAYDIKTGDHLWDFNTPNMGLETAYGNTPIMGITVADGKVFAATGHTHLKPLYRGSELHVLNESTGEEIWKIKHFSNGAPTAIAAGSVVLANAYDNSIYCFGKGETSTTVSAPEIAVAKGSPVLIRGTVIDQSPGLSKGLPAISDDSQTAWMEHIYMQQPKPTDAKGVTVHVTALDPNGNFQDLGTAISDDTGFFSLTWTPPIAGKYTVKASFAGSESYYPSEANTAFIVSEAGSVGPVVTPTTSQTPVPTPQQTTSATSSVSTSPSPVPEPKVGTPTTTYIAIGAAVIIIVAAAATVFVRKRKK